MKNKLLLLFLCITQLIIAQQVTLLQPALRDSDMKLDSLYYYSIDINNSEEILHNKQIYTLYDEEKSPTLFTLFNLIDNDDYPELKIEGNNHLIETYNNDDFGLYNFKDVSNFIKNQENEWQLSGTTKAMNDTRYSFREWDEDPLFNQMYFIFDDNFNITNIYKKESIVVNNYPTESLYYGWDSSTNTEFPSYKDVYYNTLSDDFLIERITKRIHNLDTGDEFNTHKKTFTFTTNTFENILSVWSNSLNDWENNRKQIIIYDSNNNVIEINRYLITTSNTWYLIKKIEYQYNINGYRTNRILTYIDNLRIINTTYNYNENNLLVDVVSNETIKGNLVRSFHAQLYYSPEETNAINDFTNVKIKTYPNPATTILNIESQEELNYKIYSIQGKLIKKGTALQKINLSSLEKGMYFIHLKTNTLNTIQKIIKE